MNVAVIGTGYVGLVTGTCLAETGNTVTCVDNNPDKLALLQRGGIPIFEPGLDILVKRNRDAGRLVVHRRPRDRRARRTAHLRRGRYA